MVRIDRQDQIFKTENGKIQAIVADIAEKQKIGQPVLVGTVSVEKNEQISKSLKRGGVKHEILNAKNHAREAKIIAKAGQRGAVTVATNMAGRGTDIKLGEGIAKLGGLYVIGTERHESRRIDNQLRGRAGRQGDPGRSQFFVSMEDDLMRIFGGDRMKMLMERLGLPEDVPIENSMISKSIESAQKKVEGHNFDTRKHLVEYDDVMNSHRKYIYSKRRKVLESAANESDEIKDEIISIVKEEIEAMFVALADDKEKLRTEVEAIFGEGKIRELSLDQILKYIDEEYQRREKRFGSPIMRQIEQAVYLRNIDMLWVEHLTTMEELRTGIGLRGYAQTDPLVAYKRDAYRLFQNLLAAIKSGVVKNIFRIEISAPPQVKEERPLEYQSPDPNEIGDLKDEMEEISTENTSGSKQGEGVTTVIRQKGKTVYDRMEQSTG
jgi:preprotein translocase subunit SecA